MEFITHTTNWVKGEIFEGIIILISGILFLLVSFLLWQFGTTPNSKTLIIPSLVLGTLLVGMVLALLISNSKRLSEFEEAYRQNPTEFIEQEKKRVEEFQILYPISLAASTACFIFTLVFFWFTKNDTLHAVGIALSVFGVALIIIDYFSKERADIYYQHIIQYLS